MRRTLTIAIALAAALPTHAAPVERVIHVSVDGLRGDLLADLVRAAPHTHATFVRLATEGAFTYNARTDFTHTATIPNHISMITGRPVQQPQGQPNTVHHGYEDNSPAATDTLHDDGNPNLTYVSSVYDVVHDHGLSTAYFVGKTRLAILERSYNASNGGPDTIGVDNGRDKIDSSFVMDVDGDAVATAYLAAMATAPRHYSLVHLDDPDSVGHARGWGTPEWNESVAASGRQIGMILDFVSNDPAWAGKTAVLVTADHGGVDLNHLEATLGENYTIPYFLWGPQIPAGADLYSLFANRFDPGGDRPDYNAAQQPIRNGDTANLALTLLGLPPVPGSLMRPELSLPPPCTPGDMNRDGFVNNHDLSLLVARLGVVGGATCATGDFNGDSAVGLADLALLQSRFDPLAPVSGNVVPEPDAATLAALGAVTIVLLKLRRRAPAAMCGSSVAIRATP